MGGFVVGWFGGKKNKNEWQDSRLQDERASQQLNDGMGPYGRPAENGCPPEQPLWHGHSWQPVDVDYDPGSGMFSDGYRPGPGDKPSF